MWLCKLIFMSNFLYLPFKGMDEFFRQYVLLKLYLV